MRILLSLLVAFASPCFAQSSSDVLLNQLGETPPDPNIRVRKTERTDVAPKKVARVKVKVRPKPAEDAFQKQLEVKADRIDNMPFDVNQWVQDVAYSDFAKAAHQWTAIQAQIPANFKIHAEATQLYLLWKLGLNQTFFNEWVRALANPDYAKSAPELALEALVTPNMDAWLMRSPVVFLPKQLTILQRLTADKPFVLTLQAWAALRQGQAVEPILMKLAPENKLTPYLAEREVYTHAKKNDLKGAAWALKNHMEPAVEAAKSGELSVRQDLTIARILYQAGQMKAAQEFYEKIPNQSSSYLAAREELSWVYLREGDMSKLRGQIKTLASPMFKDRFQPEVYLLRAVSDLKMCFYDQVDKDLVDFSHSNATWAKKIDEALNSGTPPAPAIADDFTKLSVRTKQVLETEVAQLNQLGDQSIGAALPAVGWQRHWKDYLAQAKGALEEARKRQVDEYTRQWKNERNALVEAIRKMRFVKVEYMSQVRQLSANSAIDGKKMLASNTESMPAGSVVGSEHDQMSFPVDNEVWSDELFKMRSAAQAQCLKKSATP